ncbi:MAG: hypothetical protein IRY99_24225, partial [Isosphaeraceae bacterium]|nr:hypothetical protein [Isosphaeraceae bacterium]
MEDLERRLALSTGQASAIPDGVDSLALADVNGDRLVDVVVAGRVSGANEIQIEDGRGWPDQGNVSSSTVNILTTLDGKQVPGAGRLAVAAGDFAGQGVSNVAVTSDRTQTVTVYQFQVVPGPAWPRTNAANTVLDAQVSPSLLGTAFTPPDLTGATGLTLAAADFDQNGVDELVVGPAGSGPNILDIMKYDPTTRTWQLTSQVDLLAVGITGGVSLSAGDLLGNGQPVIAVGSSTTGAVAVYAPSSHSWLTTIPAPTGQVGGVRVAVVANEQAPGALVVTPNSGTGQPVLIPATTWVPQPFAPSSSFNAGGGALVPLGGGWVYPKSTMMTTPPGTPKLPY